MEDTCMAWKFQLDQIQNDRLSAIIIYNFTMPDICQTMPDS